MPEPLLVAKPKPELDVEAAITAHGVGEALISFRDEKGRPTVVEQAYVLPPDTRIS